MEQHQQIARNAEVIRCHLDHLARRTINLLQILNLLHIFIPDECKNEILAEITEYRKNYAFYMLVMKKVTDANAKYLTGVLRITGNKDLADLFEQSDAWPLATEQVSTESSEIQIDDFEIIEILTNDQLFCARWRHFCNVLNFKNAEVCDLERLFNSRAPISEIISKSLKHWKSIDPVDANIKCLPAKLRKIGCFKCAEDIEDVFAKRGFERALVSPVTPRPRYWPEEDHHWQVINSFFPRRAHEHLLVDNMMKHLLTSQEKTLICGKVAITGLGGVGKSTLAKSFADSYKDVYQHIIWIDCEDGNLVSSFQELSKDLNVKPNQSPTFSLKYLVKESYGKLAEFKCLLIFDNAKCHNSIKDVLPSANYKNFHSVITSRNRRWGNEATFGIIGQIHLNIFDEMEGTAFLKGAIRNVDTCKDYQLRQLTKKLGGLPLALQIAVAAINKNNIPLPDYLQELQSTIDIIRDPVEDLGLDYKKSIYDTLSISINLVKREPRGGAMAVRLLRVFSYIRPNNVKLKFFNSVFKCKTEISDALHTLETYSLVSKTIRMESILWSTHTLIQEVIRCKNCQSLELETLRMILSCDKSFAETKLMPYTKFAESHHEIHSEYANVPSELINQLNLSELVRKQKFEEATALARLIYTPNTHKISNEYTLGVCLFKEEKLEESLEAFDNIFQKLEHVNTDSSSTSVRVRLQIIESNDYEEVNSLEVAIWLLNLQSLVGVRNSRINELLNSNFKKLQSIVIVGGSDATINISLFAEIKDVTMHGVTVCWRESPVVFQIKRISLHGVTFVKEDCQEAEKFQFSQLPLKMEKLEIVGFGSSTIILLELCKLPKTLKKLELQDVELSMPENPEELPLCIEISSLKLVSSRNKINISKFLGLCPNLSDVELFGFNLQLSFIPSNIQQMKLMYVECTEDVLAARKVKTNLYSLTLLEYVTVQEIEKLIPYFSVNNLIIQLSCHQAQPDMMKIVNCIDKSVKAVVGAIDTASRNLDITPLSKYGILKKSKYYVIENAKEGRMCADKSEFDLLISFMTRPQDFQLPSIAAAAGGLIVKPVAPIGKIDEGTSISILQMTRSGVSLDTNALDAILDVVGDRPFALYSINGPKRSGKSFMANLFLHYLHSENLSDQKPTWFQNAVSGEKYFHWRGGSQRDTFGIDMWSKPVITEIDGREVAVLLMDTQGSWDDETTLQQNAFVFALSCMLSSVLIYNVMKTIGEDNLQFLNYFSNFAMMALAENEESEEDTFQKLIFLIRDMESPEYGYGYYDDTTCPPGQRKNLKDKIKPQESQPFEVQFVRKQIANAFDNVGMFALPYPGRGLSRMDSVQDLDPEFQEYTIAFVEQMLSKKNITLKRIGGVEVTGVQFKRFVLQWALLFESEELPQVKSIVEAAVELQGAMAKQVALEYYETEMKSFFNINAKGVSEGEFLENHTVLAEESLAILNNMRKLGGKDYETRFSLELQEQIESIRDIYHAMNYAYNKANEERKCFEEIGRKQTEEMLRIEKALDIAHEKERQRYAQEIENQKAEMEKFTLEVRMKESQYQQELKELNKTMTKQRRKGVFKKMGDIFGKIWN